LEPLTGRRSSRGSSRSGLRLRVLANQALDGGRKLRALLLPEADTIERQHETILGSARNRVVIADPLNEAAVAAALLVGGNDVIKGALLGAAARKADDDHMGILCPWAENPKL